MPDLLIEIGCEELPATYTAPALARLEAGTRQALTAARLAAGPATFGSTPRRLVLAIREVGLRAEAVEEEVMGPPLEQAFKDGKPTPAAIGFARKLGLELDRLGQGEDRKGRPCLRALRRLDGASATDVLARELPGVLSGLPFPKSMRWPAPVPEGSARFARPVRWLVCLLGREVVPLNWAGLEAGRGTRGHAFLAPGPIGLEDSDFQAYSLALESAFVLVDPEVRRERILGGLRRLGNVRGVDADDADLLDEVVNLVEWPTVVAGSFDEAFLDLPPEVLREAMSSHQRYFPIADARGRLTRRFAVVLNRDQAQAPVCIEGNERVLRARLTDARFFWNEDQKTRLVDRLPLLEQMIFQAPLGSYAKKQERVSKLVKWLCDRLAVGPESREPALQAAALAKTDLTTQMVGEFPSLQGVVGEAYARAQGLPEAVARATREQYQPRGAGDPLPGTMPGALLGLAERFDNLAASFVLGQIPTGAADPYGLRRQALAVLRILRERTWKLDLDATILRACALVREDFKPPAAAPGRVAKQPLAGQEAAGRLGEFVFERLRQMLLDEGRAYDRVNAVLASAGFARDVPSLLAGLDALDALAPRPDWPRLVEVVDRIKRILSARADKAGLPLHELVAGLAPVNASLLADAAEKDLAEAFGRVRMEAESRAGAGDLAGFGATYVEGLSEPLHRFFDEVFVNVDDARLRDNRLALLASVRGFFVSRLADLSFIVLPGAPAANPKAAP